MPTRMANLRSRLPRASGELTLSQRSRNLLYVCTFSPFAHPTTVRIEVRPSLEVVMHRRRIASFAAGVALIFGGIVYGAEEAVAAGEGDFIQFNMCGILCNSGGNGSALELVNWIGTTGANWVTVNEACVSQATFMMSRLSNYRHYFTITKYGTTCGNFGNVIIWKSSFASGGSYVASLTSSGSETRKLTCKELNFPAAYYVCGTHLVHDNATLRLQQAREVGDWMRLNLTLAHPSLLGGDLNDTPTSRPLDFIYSIGCPGNPPGQGTMFEAVVPCNRAGPATLDGTTKKIDYIFYHPQRFSSLGETTAGAQFSDHRLVIATISDA